MEPTNPNSQAMETGLWTGRQQAFAMMSAKTSAAKAATIKELREARAYEVLGLTWDDFCPQYLGVCRATADEKYPRVNPTDHAVAYRHRFRDSVAVLSAMLLVLVAAVIAILRKRDNDPQ